MKIGVPSGNALACPEAARVSRSSAERTCMQIGRRTTGVIVAAGLAILLNAVPAQAVVHEIVAAWCSGQELEPPGISDPTKSNFAGPVNANGFVGAVVFDAGIGGLLVTFNYDHPASKVEGSGTFIQIGSTVA
jgi:hypothetical protein